MTHVVPGPPFVFGSLLVILALMVAAFIPESSGTWVMGKLGGSGGEDDRRERGLRQSLLRPHSVIGRPPPDSEVAGPGFGAILGNRNLL